MKPKLILQIEEPCHENWNEMAAADQGRFCATCARCVHDLTRSSDKEIARVLAANEGGICGRLRNDQLDRVLQPKKFGFLSPIARVAAVLLLLFSSRQARAQMGKLASSHPRQQTPQTAEVPRCADESAGALREQTEDTTLYTGRICDADGYALADVEVVFPKAGARVRTDRSGYFRISLPAGLPKGSNIIAVKSASGKTTNFEITKVEHRFLGQFIVQQKRKSLEPSMGFIGPRPSPSVTTPNKKS